MSTPILNNVLSAEQEQLLKLERSWLSDLQVLLARLGATEEDHDTLKESIQQLDELFLLVIVGEFNAGKSSFINALLGQALLEEGVTPTTAQVNILKYGETSGRQVLSAQLHVRTEPLPILHGLNMVDTPGTNAIIREHQAITEDFVPRSDLVLFITSADRPFTESERQFLEKIRDWGKKVVIVINKIDMFETDDEREQVVSFVRENAVTLLGLAPEVFPVSARQALRAKQGAPQFWQSSRFEGLEAYIQDTLDNTSRLKLKLLNPLGVGDSLLRKYLNITNNRLGLLRDDIQAIADIERQLSLYEEDMRRDFGFRMADIENILFDMEKRGMQFFDDTMRIARIPDLMQRDRIQRAFEQEVVADTPQAVEQRVTEMIDWLVNADFNQWQAVTKHMEKRKAEYDARMVGEVGQSFRYDREHLIDSVGRAARQVVDSYDKAGEAREIAGKAQQAVMGVAGAQLTALGLGAAFVAATTIDVTGILFAGAVAALGLVIIPARRRAAQRELTNKVSDLRQSLVQALSQQFEKEIRRSVSRINDAIAPYTRFVRGERDKLEETKTELVEAQTQESQLRAEIDVL